MAKGKNKSKGGGGDDKPNSPTIENRKARFDYAILDTMEVGMVLRGSEVKSIRDGKCSLAEGFVRVEGAGIRPSVKARAADADDGGKPAKSTKKAKVGWGAATGAPAKSGGGKAAVYRASKPGLFLHAVNIAEYPPAGPSGSPGQHKPTRTRTLLAHSREMTKLARQVETKGMTLVPLKIYFKNGKAKLLVGVARGKAAHDKRESIAKRDANRDIARAMSRKM
jgi:SsrA-binding protein